MNTLWSDLTFAFRMLRKSSRFTAAVVLILAIGIASNTIIFGLARSVFVLDKDGKVAYAETVPEVTSEPNYDAAMSALQKVAG